MSRRPYPAARSASLPLLRVRGIPIEAHWSWLPFVIFYYRWLADGLFPARYPGLAASTYLTMGLAATLLFFLSILLHELGHALWAVRERVGVDRITMWFLGGLAWIRGTSSPGKDARITVAGPAVTLVIAAVCGGVAWIGDILGWSGAGVGVPLLMAQLNAVLLVLNLMPVFPLDGGRLLHAWLWARGESRRRATVRASRAGQAFAVVVIAFGAIGPFIGVLSAPVDPRQAIDSLSLMLWGLLLLYMSYYAESNAGKVG